MLSPTRATAIKPTLRMEDDQPFAGGQGQVAGPKTTQVGTTGIPGGSSNRHEPVQLPGHMEVTLTYGVSNRPASFFRKHERYWPGNYWAIPAKTGRKEVLKEALKPHQKEEAYPGALYESSPTRMDAQPIIKEATTPRPGDPGNSSRAWHKSGYQKYHREVTQTYCKKRRGAPKEE